MPYRRKPHILSKMLRVKNPNARILVYAAVIFGSLCVSWLLILQASCQPPDIQSSFCRELTPVYSLISIAVMTLGGTMVALGFTKQSADNAAGLSIIGFFIVLIGFAIAGAPFLEDAIN